MSLKNWGDKKSQRKCCKVCIETLGSLSGMLVVMRNACKPLRAETKCHHKDSSLLLPQLQMASPSGLLLIENRSCNCGQKYSTPCLCQESAQIYSSITICPNLLMANGQCHCTLRTDWLLKPFYFDSHLDKKKLLYHKNWYWGWKAITKVLKFFG